MSKEVLIQQFQAAGQGKLSFFLVRGFFVHKQLFLDRTRL